MLIDYLQNDLLIGAIKAMLEIETTLKKLNEAVETMKSVGVPDEGMLAVTEKRNAYAIASRGYSNMIEDVYGLGWQRVVIIGRYLDFEEDEFETLPETLKV